MQNPERVQAAAKFLLQSPPGEINDVLNDIRTIIADDELLQEGVLPVLKDYNLAQFITVDVPNNNHQVCRLFFFNSGRNSRCVSRPSSAKLLKIHLPTTARRDFWIRGQRRVLPLTTLALKPLILVLLKRMPSLNHFVLHWRVRRWHIFHLITTMASLPWSQRQEIQDSLLSRLSQTSIIPQIIGLEDCGRNMILIWTTRLLSGRSTWIYIIMNRVMSNSQLHKISLSFFLLR